MAVLDRVADALHAEPHLTSSGPKRAVGHTVTKVGSSAEAAAGTSIRQCPQSYRDLSLIRIAKPNDCSRGFFSAGLAPMRT